MNNIYATAGRLRSENYDLRDALNNLRRQKERDELTWEGCVTDFKEQAEALAENAEYWENRFNWELAISNDFEDEFCSRRTVYKGLWDDSNAEVNKLEAQVRNLQGTIALKNSNLEYADAVISAFQPNTQVQNLQSDLQASNIRERNFRMEIQSLKDLLWENEEAFDTIAEIANGE